MSNIKINDLENAGAELFEDANGVMTELQDDELGVTGGLFLSFLFGKKRSFGKRSSSRKSFSSKSKSKTSFSSFSGKGKKRRSFFWF